jgi:D-lactate dehydrogenase (cytochrome)
MAAHSLRARRPRNEVAAAGEIRSDPDVVRQFLEDAAHFPGGHAEGIASPANEGEVSAVLRSAANVLPIGAQSSLTGGATPMGGLLLSTSRMNRILEIGTDAVRVEAGVTLLDLDGALARAGKYYPPSPTFAGAFVGGVIATNAAGAATFKYGTTRDWVRAITVVLPGGDVLDVERGVTTADRNGTFEIVLT